MSLYCFARPAQMVDHRFVDDVAVVRALTKAAAIKKFSRYYAAVQPDEVFKLKKLKEVNILTDY